MSDGKGSVGRRYARSDEVGTPYAVTVDEDTVNMSTVSLRERNSMRQVRVKVGVVYSVCGCVVSGVCADIGAGWCGGWAGGWCSGLGGSGETVSRVHQTRDQSIIPASFFFCTDDAPLIS